MALNIQNTNYNGEVLEQLLTVATTSNEIVEKGLIHVYSRYCQVGIHTALARGSDAAEAQGRPQG